MYMFDFFGFLFPRLPLYTKKKKLANLCFALLPLEWWFEEF